MRNFALTASSFAFALVLATPASAESLIEGLTRELADQVVNAAASGELPMLHGQQSGAAAGATGGGGFQRYGGWDFKLERLERGSDDGWQAVIAVRNAAEHRQGMVASEIKLFLITQDGETLSSWGELYKAGVEGSAAGLEPVPGTLWLEPGDMTRVRLRFDGSRGVKPARLRIQSTGATSESRTFSVAG